MLLLVDILAHFSFLGLTFPRRKAVGVCWSLSMMDGIGAALDFERLEGLLACLFSSTMMSAIETVGTAT